MKRAIVYVDGYNWYHSIFKHYPEWKWLNVESFFRGLRPHEEITAVKIFSAMIDPGNPASDARERQQRYVFPEEKKTDVNLAVELISDAIGENCDAMFIVSGDSDIQPAVEWVATKKPEISITVYIPALPSEQPHRRTDYYRTKKINVECKFLPLGNIKEHQLPNVVKLPDGRLAVRPHLWQGKSN